MRACAHSALTRPISDSIAALSHGDEIAPIEGLMPFSLMVRPGRSDTCCDPWSEWRVQPAGGLLRAIAILSASSASPASMRSDMYLVTSDLRKGTAVGILDRIHPTLLGPSPCGAAWGSCNPGRPLS